MKTTFKDNHINIYGTIKIKQTPNIVASASSKFLINNQERPLKMNQADLSFKGLSFYSKNTIVEKFASEFGEAARANFESKIAKAVALKHPEIELSGDQLKFHESSFAKKVLDLLISPVTTMPVDLINGTLNSLKKVPGIKNSSWLDNALNVKFLKNRRDFVENTSNIAAIKHYCEIIEKGDKGFLKGHSRLKPNISNYNSETERAITRVVTGLIPAFFLANDAYNLSIYMKNNKDIAKKEKQRRFKQEVIRIAITAAVTFGTLRLFTKSSNGSMTVSTAITSATVTISEILGRIIAGNPVLPVSKKDALYYAKKQGKLKQEDKSKDSTKTQFKGNNSSDSSKPKEKGQLNLNNVAKVIGGLLLFGLAADNISNMKSVKPKLDEIAKRYKSLFTKDFTIERDKFNGITAKLRLNGFDKIADEYERLIKNQKGDFIKLGKQQHEAKFMIIHNILAFPFRFAWGTIMLPYKKIAKPLYTAIADSLKSKPIKDKNVSTSEKEIKKEAAKQMEMLKNSIQFLSKIKTKNDDEFKKIVNDNLISSLDNVTKSNYSNAKLGAMFKIVHSTITSLFLILDNYNMVMIDSNGDDKDLAEQKAKERILQRTAKILYGAFLVKLFNGVFANLYNSSILGAEVVNSAQVLTNETLERKSVGLPLSESTQDEIRESERKNLEATGFKGAYFRFMAKLTGKKSLAEIKDEKEAKTK